MNRLYVFTLINVLALSLATSDTFGQSAAPSELAGYRKHLNYRKLGHQIRVVSIRAGNHDKSGINKYYFSIEFIGTVTGKLSEGEKTKVTKMPGEKFGEIEVKALDIWNESPKANDTATIKITGDQIREFISSVMKEHSAEEEDVSVEIEISHFESNKQFVFFGEDEKIGSVKFAPVPKKGSFTKIRKNIDLEIAGDKSTKVQVQVIYENPAASTVGKSSKKSDSNDPENKSKG